MGPPGCVTKSRRKSLRVTKKLRMATKEQLSAMPRPDYHRRQDISIKVLRSLARRRSHHQGGARPIFYSREVSLSSLYKENVKEKYIYQVFSGVSKIGQGCFGDVFRACSRDDSKNYAIKVTNDTHAFVDCGEVRRLEKIPEHENCVKFFMAWQETYRLYIQMELCQTSLDKVVMVYHHIEERQCWEVFLDVAQGLKHLHDNMLIHLDIKPANIMITSTGVCKIGDFGLLIDLDELEQQQRERALSVSEGDGKYLALEVLTDKTYSKAGDIFSLGLMMLELASDVALPSSGAYWRQLREGALPDCYLNRSLSQNFRKLIEGMTQVDYVERPTVDDILQNPFALSIFQYREKEGRVNLMANWENDFAAYEASHPEARLDIPVIQLQGPSPPRRTYPITYVRPLSPNRSPLQELDLSLLDLNENENELAAGPGSGPINARLRVVRRLFNQ